MPLEQLFEILGYFEEILDAETGKCYGLRSIEKPTHALGYSGLREHTYQKGDKILVNKGHKTNINHTFKTQTRCYLVAHATCGKSKLTHPLDKSL